MKRTVVRILAIALALLILFTFAFSMLFSTLANAAGALPDYGPPEVAADAYVLMDAATGQVIAQKNAGEARYPASITKIMTLALVLESVDLDSQWADRVTVSQAAVDALIPRATMVALIPGEEVTLLDLLYATQVESANDAAHVLGEYAAGGMDVFANRMNEKARELGLAGTHFTNASGQPHQNHYTTAHDMAAITRWALQVPWFRDIFAATEYRMEPTNKQPAGRDFHSSNVALQPYSSYYCQGTTGSKTGYTDDARYTMVTTARQNGTELICVVMNCPTNESKFQSVKQLLDYGFANFRQVRFEAGQLEAARVPVYGGGSEPLGDITVEGSGSVSFLLHNGLELSAVEVHRDIPQRYVIGEPFEPMAVVTVQGSGAMPDAVLAEVPLAWSGLEELLAAHTQPAAGGAAAQAGEGPGVGLWLAVGIPALLAGLLVGRIVYVQARRARRRRARLLAARAQQAVSIAPRPAARARQQAEPPPPRRSGEPRLRVAYPANAYAGQPHRVGRAR